MSFPPDKMTGPSLLIFAFHICRAGPSRDVAWFEGTFFDCFGLIFICSHAAHFTAAISSTSLLDMGSGTRKTNRAGNHRSPPCIIRHIQSPAW
jgi:hypothetical protein